MPSRVLVACIVALLAATALAADAPALELTADEQAICDLTNVERRNAGLEPLRPNAKLFDAARKHSANMAERDKLTHKLDGKSVDGRAEDVGYKYSVIGENVAWNQKSPEAVVASWMKSSGHRANILNENFEDIGVGIARNEKGEPYYTQNFGKGPTIRESGRRPRPLDEGTGRALAAAEAKGKLSFSITNETEKTVKITLPFSDEATSLKPGMRGNFSLSGLAEYPPAKIRVGKSTFELVIEQDAKYSIESLDNKFVISKEEQVELAK